MWRAAPAFLVSLMLVASAGAARAADSLTAGDRDWLRGNLNLAGDSPAVLELSEAQQSRLHALIRGAGNSDRKRQAVVQFLTEATDRSFQNTLEDSTLPSPAGAVGANRR